MNKSIHLCFVLFLIYGCSKGTNLDYSIPKPQVNYFDKGEYIVFTCSNFSKNITISYNDSIICVIKSSNDTIKVQRKNQFYNNYFKITYTTNEQLFVDSILYNNDLNLLLGTKKRLIAHRGYSSVFPENTGISIINAALNGMPYLDCDFWLTKDKKWVLIHDEMVNRTSNASGKVSNYTFDSLTKFNFGYPKKYGNKYNEKILSIDSVIQLCKSYNIVPFFEIKDSAYTNADLIKFISTINSNYTYSQYSINSFIVKSLYDIRKIDSRVILALNSQNYTQLDRKILNDIYPALYYYPSTDYKNINLLNLYNDGFPIGIYTEDNIDLISTYMKMGFFTFTNIIPFKLF